METNTTRVMFAQQCLTCVTREGKATACVTREVYTPITQFSLASIVHEQFFCFERR